MDGFKLVDGFAEGMRLNEGFILVDGLPEGIKLSEGASDFAALLGEKEG